MRKSKLLTLLPISAMMIAPVSIASCSCGGDKTQAEKVMDAIVDPTKITTPVAITDFVGSLKGLNETDRQKEVIYDLFCVFNVKQSEDFFDFDKTFIQMYNENIVSFKTNITKCSLSIDNNNNITSTFLGYVSFVFTKETKGKVCDVEMTFKENDYVMMTYDLVDAKVTPDDKCSLSYESKLEESDIGFIKVKYNGGQNGALFGIETIGADVDDSIPKNSHNWVKKS